MNNKHFDKLNIVYENRQLVYSFCPYHNDKLRPNLSINLQEGEYFARYKCWSCGASGRLSKKQIEKLELSPVSVSMTCRSQREWQELMELYKESLNQLPLYKTGVMNSIGCNNTQRFNEWPIGFDDNAYTIPMTRGYGGDMISGIQRRFNDGTKCCVKGSRLGCFVPYTYNTWGREATLFICEGWSDAVSVHNLGFNAIGRSNCWDCDSIESLLWEEAFATIIIIPDNNKVGLAGANELLDRLYTTQAEYNCSLGCDFMGLFAFKGAVDIREYIHKVGRDIVIQELNHYA